MAAYVWRIPPLGGGWGVTRGGVSCFYLFGEPLKTWTYAMLMYRFTTSLYCIAEPHKRVSMTTFGSRLSTCYRVLEKERLLTYGVDSPGQSRGISPLQVVAELVLSLLLWVYIENPTLRSTRLRLVLPIRRNWIFFVDSDKTETAHIGCIPTPRKREQS